MVNFIDASVVSKKITVTVGIGLPYIILLLVCCIEYSILIAFDSFFEIKILDHLAFINQFPYRIILGK